MTTLNANTTSPTPPPRRFRWLRLCAILLFLLVVFATGAFLATRWWLNRYLHGDAFRQTISQKTSHALRAQGEFLPLHWAGQSVYSDGFYARGALDSHIDEIRLDQVRAELDVQGLIRRAWRVNHLEIQRLKLILKPALSSPIPSPIAPTGQPQSPPKLGPIRIQELNLSWPMPGNTTGNLERARATVEISPNTISLTGFDGILRLPDLPPLTVDTCRLRAQQQTLHIIEANLTSSSEGAFACTGQASLDPNQDLNLLIGFQNVPLAPWLPVDWRARLTGRAQGACNLRGPAASISSMTATGSIQLLNARLEALPVLDRIAMFTQTQQFRSIGFQRATANFHHANQQLQLRNVSLESTGLLRIEGNCDIQNQTIEGKFDVGVAPATLRWLPGSRSQVFTLEREGYLWTTVRITGPLTNIQEDLSSRLVAAAGTEVIEGVRTTIEQGAQKALDLFRNLLP